MESYPLSWIGRLDVVKTSLLLKAIYRFSTVPIKIPMAFLTKIDKNNFTIYMEQQKTMDTKSILSKKNKTGGITGPHFKIYYKATVITTVQYWSKYRPTNGTKSPEINPWVYSQLTFDNSVKNIQQRKDSVFKEWCWENLYPYAEEWN